MSYSELLMIFSIVSGGVATIILYIVKWQVGRYSLNFNHLDVKQKAMVKVSVSLLFVALVTFFFAILAI
jgi:hypothetical protein